MPVSDSATAPTTATIVPDAERIEFLPRLFGERHFILGETHVFEFMSQLSADYNGAFWTFYELDGEPLFLAPASGKRFRISWHGNGYEGEVSAEGAGIIATLFTLSHLSIALSDDHFGDAYYRLYDHVGHHPEAAEILSAID